MYWQLVLIEHLADLFKSYSSLPLRIVQPGCCFLVGCAGQGERGGNSGERGGWWS